MNRDDDHTFTVGLILVIIFVLTLYIHEYMDKPKNHGYGGSPGHMSPLEVQEMYNRNKHKDTP